MDPSLLATIETEFKTNKPFINSLLIVRHGYIVYEAYFNAYDHSRLNDVHSVTKSVTSALVGVAQANGKLTDLDLTLADALPEYFADNQNADKRDITLRHLLMMRSGIEFDEDELYAAVHNNPEGEKTWLERDLLTYAFSLPMAHQPGEAWYYSTLDTQLISAIFQRSTEISLEDYAVEVLFAPLGIKDYEWEQDAAGYTIGGGLLQLTSRDMAKFGYLYLNNGQWESQQIVPSEWVKLTTTPQGDGYYGDKVLPIEWYGYLWWTWKPEWFSGYRSIWAEGYAGQAISIFPDLDMVVVITTNSDVTPEQASEQEKVWQQIINESVIPAIQDK